ncbi:MAG: DNA polymerase III subunit chi [Pseudomonadota bacterium]
MSEIRFYHLTERPLETVLPTMLEKCLERGWRAVVRVGTPERLGELDTFLWTYASEGFLPHGAAGDDLAGTGADQPVWLTTGEELPNAPDTLFLVQGAQGTPDLYTRFTTTALIFDGHDKDAVAQARDQWRGVCSVGLKAVYWAQDARGAWLRKAENAPQATPPAA